ncbi:MAG: hypothetical protein E5Y61_03855 [Mesorhizobium sp.]|nr:MAG: hypothetical protein E5Y61_03855 [Mesorhizobium sp.]TIN21384.1 MAG: hypothetical protein E5Y59_02085 [Mesorhizobium sp.]
MDAAKRGRNAATGTEQAKDAPVWDPRFEAGGEPARAKKFGDQSVHELEAMLALGSEQPRPQHRVRANGLGQCANLIGVHKSLGKARYRAGVDPIEIAQQLDRGMGTGRQEELINAQLRMRRIMMARVFFAKHNRAGALEKLRPAGRQRLAARADLADQAEGERVLVDVIETPLRQVIKQLDRIEIWKIGAQETLGVVTVKRLKMQQGGRLTIIVFNLDAGGRAMPVCLPARENEPRVAE